MNKKQAVNNQMSKVGKVSHDTLGSVPRPVVESYRSQGFYTLGKISKKTLGFHASHHYEINSKPMRYPFN